MKRKEFLKICGGSCLALTGIALLVPGCAPTHYVQAVPQNKRVQVSKSEFVTIKKEKSSYRSYIIVKVEQMAYPLVIYRFSDTSFSALLLQCTHQGNELTVNGNLLSCPAHGSEFGTDGKVLQGPAEQQLTSYSVTTDENNIYLQLV